MHIKRTHLHSHSCKFLWRTGSTENEAQGKPHSDLSTVWCARVLSITLCVCVCVCVCLNLNLQEGFKFILNLDLSFHQIIMKMCHSFHVWTDFNIDIIRNVPWVSNHHIRLISEGSCDTEHWKMMLKIQLWSQE